MASGCFWGLLRRNDKRMTELNIRPIYTILEWRKLNKPKRWIAREMGLPEADVNAVLRVCGDTRRDGISLEQYDRIQALVNEEASLNDICRTTGCDWRTAKKWFPSAGWQTRGGKGASMMARANRLYETKGL